MIRLSPDPAFLKRADTRERRLFIQHIGHPTGILRADNDWLPFIADERDGTDLRQLTQHPFHHNGDGLGFNCIPHSTGDTL